MVHAYDPSMRETEAGGQSAQTVSLRPAIVHILDSVILISGLELLCVLNRLKIV